MSWCASSFQDIVVFLKMMYFSHLAWSCALILRGCVMRKSVCVCVCVPHSGASTVDVIHRTRTHRVSTKSSTFSSRSLKKSVETDTRSVFLTQFFFLYRDHDSLVLKIQRLSLFSDERSRHNWPKYKHTNRNISSVLHHFQPQNITLKMNLENVVFLPPSKDQHILLW